MSVAIHPVKLQGLWSCGWALDLHVIASEFIGYDPLGHAQFDTKRSELGELLYQLKYRNNHSSLPAVVRTVVSFLSKEKLSVELVLAVPPSNKARAFQPLQEIAKGVAGQIRAKFVAEAVEKVRQTEQMKGVPIYSERIRILEGAFRASSEHISGRHVLLIDDLYRSGATLATVAKEIVGTLVPWQTLQLCWRTPEVWPLRKSFEVFDS